jgi:phosphate transport system substrate-binding protein
MKAKLTRRAFLGAAGFALVAGRAARAGPEIRLVGYNDMAEMIGALDAAFARLHPQWRLAAELNGTKFGPAALADGRATIAPMGARFTPTQLAIYRAAVGRDPIGFRIAHASLSSKALSGPNGIFVHASNPLSQVDLPSLARLFSSAGPHLWGELGVGGAMASRPIRLAGMAPQTPLALEFQDALFPRRAFAPDMHGFVQSRDLVAFVAGEPLALGFAALNREPDGVRVLGLARTRGAPAVQATERSLRAGAYPLDRHLWLYARQDSAGRLEPPARAYLQFALSDRGQAIIGSGSLGYLRLGAEECRREQARLG